MSALAELAVQCEKRGWRLSLDGRYLETKNQPGLEVNVLEVRTHSRELLASVPAAAGELEEAAVDAARALERQGLIT